MTTTIETMILEKVRCVGVFSLPFIKKKKKNNVNNEEDGGDIVIENNEGNEHIDNDVSSPLLCHVFLNASSKGEKKLYCVKVDNASIHLVSPFFEHTLTLQKYYTFVDPNEDMDVEKSSKRKSGRKDRKKRKKSKMLVEKSHSNDEEENEPVSSEKHATAVDTSGSDDDVTIGDPWQIMSFFQDLTIYEVTKWNVYEPSIHRSTTIAEAITDIAKHNFYYLYMISINPNTPLRKEDVSLGFHALYKSPPSPFATQSVKNAMVPTVPLPILWHDNEECMRKFTHWLETFFSMCRPSGSSSSVNNDDDKTVKKKKKKKVTSIEMMKEQLKSTSTKLTGFWDYLITTENKYCRDYNDEPVHPLLSHLKENRSYLEISSGNDQTTTTTTTTTTKIKPKLIYHRLKEVIASFNVFGRISPLLLCSIDNMAHIHPIFTILHLQYRNTSFNTAYTLDKVVTSLDIIHMDNYLLQDLFVFFQIFQFIVHQTQSPGHNYDYDDYSALTPPFLVFMSSEKDHFFNNYVTLVDRHILKNLSLITDLWIRTLTDEERDALKKNKDIPIVEFTVLIVVRYIIAYFEKKGRNIADRAKSTYYSFSLFELHELCKQFNASTLKLVKGDSKKSFSLFNSRQDTIDYLIKCLSHFTQKKPVPIPSMTSKLSLKDGYTLEFSCNRYEWQFNRDKMLGVTEERDAKRLKLFILCQQMNSLVYDKRLHDLLSLKIDPAAISSVTYDMHINEKEMDIDVVYEMDLYRRRIHKDRDGIDNGDGEEEEDDDDDERKVSIELVVYNTHDTKANLEYLYDKYYKHNLSTTLVIRPSENFHVNKALYSFFTKKDYTKEIFHDNCRTTNDFHLSEKKNAIALQNYQVVIVPFAHFLDTHNYYNVMSWIYSNFTEKSALKKVIICGTLDIVPSSGYGQPFIDHLRLIEPARFSIGSMDRGASMNDSFESLISHYWVNSRIEQRATTTLKAQYTSLVEVIIQQQRKNTGMNRPLFRIKGESSLNGFVDKLIPITYPFISTRTQKIPISITFNIIKRDRYTQNHENVAVNTFRNGQSLNYILFHENLYERKTNLNDKIPHIHIYIITYAYLSTLSRNEMFLLFSIIDNLIVVDIQLNGGGGGGDHEDEMNIIGMFQGKKHQYSVKSSYFDVQKCLK
jgi:ribosomal protein S8E